MSEGKEMAAVVRSLSSCDPTRTWSSTQSKTSSKQVERSKSKMSQIDTNNSNRKSERRSSKRLSTTSACSSASLATHSRHEEDDNAIGAKSQVSIALTVPSMASRHKKRKSVSVSRTYIDEETVSLLLQIYELNTLDIWLHKKGGSFDIFGGKLLVSPGSYNPKKDFITVKRIVASEREQFIPLLSRLEKINGQIFEFSTNKPQLKQTVDVLLPCQPITHPQLQEVRLMARYAGEEEWAYHDWNLYGDDPNQPMMEFKTDRPGVFVATLRPRVEKFTLTDQGLLYNARLNRYISLRFPKKCVNSNTQFELRIIPFDMEKALLVKEEFRMNYPDLNDFELATDYYEVACDRAEAFKRPVSVKLPSGSDGFTEEHRDELVIMRKDMESGQWNIVESNMKITRTTVSFDTKSLGRFIILKAPAARKLRMKNAVPVLEKKMTKCRRELLIFKKMMKKSWNIWVEVVKPSQVCAVIERREGEGLICISKPEEISVDLDSKLEYSAPVNHQNSSQSDHHGDSLAPTESDLEFESQLSEEPSSEFVSIYDLEPEENGHHSYNSLSSASRRASRKKSIVKKEIQYIEIDDCTNCGSVQLTGPVRMVEDEPQYLFFLENQPENYVTFEIEPVDTDMDDGLDLVIKFLTEHTSDDGLVLKSLVRECSLTITAEQVKDYFWVEPEPEPEPEVADERLEEETVSSVPTATTSRAETAKSIQERAREQSDMIKRLSMALRPREMVYREPRVLSGRSLQTISRLVEEGLTLAVYLDMPDSTITGIGFDALSNGYSLSEVTYRILLRWKRTTRARGDKAVEELANALRGMSRHDIVAVIWEAHHKNAELTPHSFAHLHTDDEQDNSTNIMNGLQSNQTLTIRQFNF